MQVEGIETESPGGGVHSYYILKPPDKLDEAFYTLHCERVWFFNSFGLKLCIDFTCVTEWGMVSSAIWGLGHIHGQRSAEKHLMLICISLNNKIYMVLKRQTKMQTSYRSALNTTGSPTTTQCPRLEIAFSYVECSESVSVLFFMHVFIEY